jgi:hypothetical protein
VRTYNATTVSANSNEASALRTTIWYLHNNPTPVTGNTNAQANLILNQVAPPETATTLFNYDANRDSFAGRLVNKGGAATETDLAKYQNWLSDALSTNLTINGQVKVKFWSAMKDFSLGKAGSVTVFLNEVNGATTTTLCQGTLSQAAWQAGAATWVEKELTFNCANKTLLAGRQLEVKIVVDGNAGDDMWFAYDTVQYQTRVELP